MKTIIVLPYLAALSLVIEHEKQLNVISAEPNCFVSPNFCKNHLHLKFDDLEDKHETFARQSNYVMPEMSDIEKIAEFEKQNPVDMVHCMAGVSRSPAIAYFIYRLRGNSKEDSLAKVTNEYTKPNTRIIRLAEEYLC